MHCWCENITVDVCKNLSSSTPKRLLQVISVGQTGDNSLLRKKIIRKLMKGPLSPFNRDLIEEVRREFLIPPSAQKYRLKLFENGKTSRIYNSYREYEGWKYLYNITRVLFPLEYKRKGFYIEAGAFDGEYSSNSLFLEIDYGWDGLLIEPDGSLFEELVKKNRKAWACHCCLSPRPYPHQTILSKIDSAGGQVMSIYSRIYNSIKESRTNEVRKEFGVPIYEAVQCIPLHTLLLALNQSHVDFAIIDVEDVEVDLLKNFAWDKISVDVWAIEHRNPVHKFGRDVLDPDFIRWFESKGYIYFNVGSYALDYIFIKKNSKYYEMHHKRLRI